MKKRLSYLVLGSFGLLFILIIFFENTIDNVELLEDISNTVALIFFLSSISLAVKNLK
jgi:hypothetical protein